jgi:hypothetical protein
VLDKQTKRWRWATQPGDQPYPGFHAMWADSRHVLPPTGTPVEQAGKSPGFNAAFNAASLPACSSDLGGSRNHDVMTSLVNASVLVSAPTTFKVGPIQRAFPITVTNAASVSNFFRLTFSDASIASFDQQTNVDQLDVQLLPFSSTTPVAYLDATATTPEIVTVAELDLSGCGVNANLVSCPNPPVKSGGQTGSVTLNLDPTNPVFQNGANATTEKHNPLVTAPLVTAPMVTAPLVTAPMVTAPLVTASGQQNPLVTAPLVTAPLVTASAPSDWDGKNVTQYTWTVTGDTDTVNSGQYAQLFLDNGGALNSAYGSELRIFRRTSHTMVVSDPANPGKCMTISVPQEELISSIPNPLVTAPLVTAPFVGDNAKNPLVTAATFVASPPDESNNSGSNALAAVTPGPNSSLSLAGNSSSASAKKAPPALPAGGGDLRDARDNRTYVSLLLYWRNGTTSPPQISTPAIALVPTSVNIVNGAPEAAPVVTFFAPDLIVFGTPTFAPASVTVTGQTLLTWTLKNDGNGNASAADGAFTAAYYLSADSVVGGNDILLGTDDQLTPPGTPFAAGGVHTFTKPLTIPAGVTAGTYHLLIKVDNGGEISESHEDNNVVDAGSLNVIAPGVLFAATDNEEFHGQPSKLARIYVTGATVTATTITPAAFPINGLADGGGFLYTGEPFTNKLRQVDYDGNLISSLSASGFPNTAWNEDFAFDGTSFYHAHYDGSGGQIDKINPVTGANLETKLAPCAAATMFSAPVGITFVGSQLWISCWDAGEVGTWDPISNTFVPKFTVPTLAGGLAYDPAYGILWVGRSGGFIEPYDLNGTLLGSPIQPFGAMSDTIDGLEFIALPLAVRVDFESPGLGESVRQQIDPYTAAGVTFTAEHTGLFDGVVGLVKNSSSATSACVPPNSANQLLGTAPVDGSIGLSGFGIRGTFADGGIAGSRTISVDVQALSEATVRLRLYDSANTLLATATANPPATGTCSEAPGGARGTAALNATAAGVAYVIIDTVPSPAPGGFVFVIDNFRFR